MAQFVLAIISLSAFGTIVAVLLMERYVLSPATADKFSEHGGPHIILFAGVVFVICLLTHNIIHLME